MSGIQNNPKYQAWEGDMLPSVASAKKRGSALSQVLPSMGGGDILGAHGCVETSMVRVCADEEHQKPRRLSAPGAIQHQQVGTSSVVVEHDFLQVSRSCSEKVFMQAGKSQSSTQQARARQVRQFAIEAGDAMDDMEMRLRKRQFVLPIAVVLLCALVLLGTRVPLEPLSGRLVAFEVVGSSVVILSCAFALLAWWRSEGDRDSGTTEEGAWSLQGRTVSVVWALLTYVVCTLLSLSAGPRRQQLLGLDDLADGVACEEGASTQWVALMLGFTSVSRFLPFEVYMPLSVLICLQQLVLVLIFPRPECNAPVVGVGGPLLNMPPAVVTALQLQVLAAQFAIASWRFRADGAIRKLQDTYATRSDIAFAHRNRGDASASVKSPLEVIVEELTDEEMALRQLACDVAVELPCCEATLALLSVLQQIADSVERCSGRLQGTRLSLAVTHMQQNLKTPTEVNAKRVARFLQQSFMNDTFSDLSTEVPNLHTPDAASSLSQSHRDDHSKGGVGESPVSMNSFLSIDDNSGHGGRHMAKLCTVTGRKELWGLGLWSFDAAKVEAENGTILQVTGFELLSCYGILRRDRLLNFLQKLEDGYEKGIPYHTHVHAADVCNAVTVIFGSLGLLSNPFFSEPRIVGLLVAALGHDLGHFGRNNHFLISTKHWLATMYNDRSVLENFHASSLFRIIDSDRGHDVVGGLVRRFEGTRLLADFPIEEYRKTRQLIIALILATDTQSHFEALAEFRLRLSALEATVDSHGARGFDPLENPKDMQELACLLFRAADIGHSAKEWDIHEMWSIRVTDEFFLQGDEERRLGLPISPLCERAGFVLANSQVGFLEFVCVPTWFAIARYEALTTQAKKHSTMKRRSSDHSSGQEGKKHRGRTLDTDDQFSEDQVVRLTADNPEEPVSPGTGTGNKSPRGQVAISFMLGLCEANLEEWTRRQKTNCRASTMDISSQDDSVVGAASA